MRDTLNQYPTCKSTLKGCKFTENKLTKKDRFNC